jgi:hypothetical protein
LIAPQAGGSRRRAALQRALEISISLGFLILALRGINLAALWQGIGRNPGDCARAAHADPIVHQGVALAIAFLPEYLRYGSVFGDGRRLSASNVLPARGRTGAAGAAGQR